MLADRTSAAFGGGETVAISAGRVLVLASHHDGTLEAMVELLDELRTFPLLHASRVIGWIEELPDSATLSGRLDAFVLDIGAYVSSSKAEPSRSTCAPRPGSAGA